MRTANDLSGFTFGRLTVLYRNGSNKRGLAVWHCKCQCGNEVDCVGSELTRGNVKSCGCLQKDLARQMRIKMNRYDLSGDYGIGFTGKEEPFLFDKDDFDKIKDYCWRVRKDGYLDAKLRDGSGKRIMFHELIMGCKNVDHIGGILTRNDNRKSNLRLPDDRYSFETYNNMNKEIQTNNKSGHTGVIWHKRDHVWEAYISIDHKQIYLGRFSEMKDAVKARESAEHEYFGEWSRSESQKKYKEVSPKWENTARKTKLV